MSSYGSRRDRVLDNDPHWERLMLKGLTASPKPQPAQDDNSHLVEGLARLRKANPVNHLLPASQNWLKSVPEEARPVALATRYARIVNVLAQHWNDPDACHAYFNDLLIDRRGNRQGFPAAVRADIRILQDYFVRSKPVGNSGLSVGK